MTLQHRGCGGDIPRPAKGDQAVVLAQRAVEAGAHGDLEAQVPVDLVVDVLEQLQRDRPAGRQVHDLVETPIDVAPARQDVRAALLDRKSTRLNSSHVEISYAVFCLKKK